MDKANVKKLFVVDKQAIDLMLGKLFKANGLYIMVMPYGPELNFL